MARSRGGPPAGYGPGSGGDDSGGGGDSGGDDDSGGGGGGGGGSPGGSSPPPSDVGGPGGGDDDSSDGDGGSPGGSSPPPSDVGGPGGGDDTDAPQDTERTSAMPAGPGENTDPDAGGGLRDRLGSAVGSVRDRVTSAERDESVVDRFTTGGFLSERGESAGLLPSEARASVPGREDLTVDISETRAREVARDSAAVGRQLDVGAVTNAQAAVVAPFTGGQGVSPDSQDIDPLDDPEGETAAENFLEGGASLPFDVPTSVTTGETAAEAGQATLEGGIQEEGTGDVSETAVAVGRDEAAETAAAAEENPAEFAGAVGAGLLLGGAGAAAGGTAASGLRAGVRAELDPRVGTFGTTLETRAGRGLRDFLRDDRGQADLTGPSRYRGGGGDTGDTGGLPDDVQEALDNLEDAGSTELPQDPAGMSFRPEQDREADIGAADPVQQRREQARREDASARTTTGSLGLDERPTRDAVTREDPLPDTVSDATERQRDAERRFDERADDTVAGDGETTTPRVDADADAVVGSALGGLLGADADARARTPLDLDIFDRQDTPPAVRSDPDIDVSGRQDTPTDTGQDTDTRQDSPLDLRDATRTDTRDPGRDAGRDPDPVRTDPPDVDLPIELDSGTDNDAGTSAFAVSSEVFGTGVAQDLDEFRERL